jgi:hypothetical protein
MNFTQLHERLRNFIVHRIHSGLLSGTALAAKTGLQPSHISNFIHRKRKLSLPALDRVLDALSISVYDLAPQLVIGESPAVPLLGAGNIYYVPLVSPAAAIHSRHITQPITRELIPVPLAMLEELRPRRTASRRDWHRFVAVRIKPDHALPMLPVLRPQSVVVLDRQYNSLTPYRPMHLDIYGVDAGHDVLLFRYVSFESRRVILRPHVLEYPVELIDIGEDASPTDVIVGRVCICISGL